MKLWDIAKTLGSVALQVALPGVGSRIVGEVNKLLPADKKLPAGATGNDINNAVANLPPEQQASVMEKEFDVDIERLKQAGESNRAMLAAEANSTHTTRPRIALGAFRVVSFISLLIVSMWSYAILDGDKELLKAIVDGWPWVAVLIGPFVGWLNSYFGILKQEHKNKLDAANGGSTPSGIAGILGSLINRK